MQEAIKTIKELDKTFKLFNRFEKVCLLNEVKCECIGIGVFRAPGWPHTTHSEGGGSLVGTPGERHKSLSCLTRCSLPHAYFIDLRFIPQTYRHCVGANWQLCVSELRWEFDDI